MRRSLDEEDSVLQSPSRRSVARHLSVPWHHRLPWCRAIAFCVIATWVPALSWGQTTLTPTEQSTEALSTAEATVAPSNLHAAEARDYYVEARSVGTRRETEPPRYVRNLSELEYFEGPAATWLDLGLDYRIRYEYRDDDFRRPVSGLDEPLMLRARSYLGVKQLLDPFRCFVEFEDARRYNSQFPQDDRDVNEHELIQIAGELYFEDGLGDDRPLRFQAGRFAFEYTDRRLIARNEWRNTTNTFQGFRTILGQQSNDWQVDVLALQPIERLIQQFDRVDEEQWFYGVIGDWRRWSEIITLQPYYLVLDQDGKGNRIDREIHTLALRGYGIVGQTGYDYDFDVAWQFGRHGSAAHRAFAFTTELGYTFEHDWKPRLSGFMGYASGDRDPLDNTNERFDRLFGFGRPWSANDYFRWENVVAPKTRLEFRPHEKLRIDAGYGVFWLASDTDAWPAANLRDPTGQSGDFIGHEFDIRARVAVTPRLDVTLGYAHFIPGAFPRNTGRSDDTDFFYVETSTRLFK